MTRADLKHCGKIPDAREELNRSVREGRIESRHSINSLEGMGSSSHDLGAELRMHSFTVNCDTFSNEEKVAKKKVTWGWQRQGVRTVYIATQCSVPEYAAAAWTPWLSSSNIEKLERTLLQAAGAITHHVRSTPTEAVLYEADLPRLEHRLKTLSVLQTNNWNSLDVEDPLRVVLNDSMRLRLRRPDWRTTVLAALSSLGLLTYHPGDHSPPRPDPPWSRPPPAPTAMTDVLKSMSRVQQLAATLAAIEDTGPTDIQVYTDGSTHEGTTDGGAGMVAMSGEDIIERWHFPTGRWSSSYQAEKSAMMRAISWLDGYEDWQSALVLCDSKSLVETLANSNQPDGDVHRIQSAIAELCMKKEVRIQWVPGHCNLRGNELADLEAKLGSEVAQPRVPLDSSTRTALIRREERQSSLTHPRLTALYTTRPREEEEALLKKADRTDLIRFRCGHHPHLRRWQHMTGMSETDSCRLCAEEEESSEHLWLRCPAFIAERQRLGLGRTFDELVRLQCASLALLRIIFRRLL